MGRIETHYRRRFETLLAARGGTDAPAEAKRLWALAAEHSVANGIPPSLVAAHLCADLARDAGTTAAFPRRFVCDAGLGGLARWLRGAGYESFWSPELDDAAVIREAQRHSATLITSDSLMLERGVLRDAVVPSVFVPSTLTCEQQLQIVFHELGLVLLEPRCMHCGAELQKIEKHTVSERIPPKTARWLDDYFICANCGRLFWRGTHWQRIRSTLEKIQLRSTAITLLAALHRRLPGRAPS
jgi:uncharacterized protein with PIN domain